MTSPLLLVSKGTPASAAALTSGTSPAPELEPRSSSAPSSEIPKETRTMEKFSLAFKGARVKSSNTANEYPRST